MEADDVVQSIDIPVVPLCWTVKSFDRERISLEELRAYLTKNSIQQALKMMSSFGIIDPRYTAQPSTMQPVTGGSCSERQFPISLPNEYVAHTTGGPT